MNIDLKEVQMAKYSVHNNIMPTSGIRDVDPRILATIKAKAQEREYEVVDDPIGRVKFKTYTPEDSALTHNAANLITYYCQLCGVKCLVTNTNIDSLPRRQTDNSIIIVNSPQKAFNSNEMQGNNMLQLSKDQVIFKRYLQKGNIQIIKRQNGKLEKQWVWMCGWCKVDIAYQCVPHETPLPQEIGFNEKKHKYKDFEHYTRVNGPVLCKLPLINKDIPHLYILPNSLVRNYAQCMTIMNFSNQDQSSKIQDIREDFEEQFEDEEIIGIMEKNIKQEDVFDQYFPEETDSMLVTECKQEEKSSKSETSERVTHEFEEPRKVRKLNN